MNELDAVIKEATALYGNADEEALIVSIGRRERAIEAGQAPLTGRDVAYESGIMGLAEARALGVKVLRRWNKELYSLACPAAGTNDKERQALFSALNLGEAAVIGTVASMLIALSVPGAVAAPLAALVVKKFIWPAKDVLCDAWGEAIT